MSSSKLAGDTVPPDSQASPSSSHNRFSSPPRATRNGAQKEEKPPSVTPRRFRKFFTPRSHDYPISLAREALHEITGPTLNRNLTQSSPLRPFKSVNSKEESPTSFIRGSKRQKTTHTPETSPRKGSRRKHYNSLEETNISEFGEHLQSSPCERAVLDTNHEEKESMEEYRYQKPAEPLKRIKSVVNGGLGGQLLNLNINSSVGRRRQYYDYTANGLSRYHSLFVSC
jgi:hypothetical protein